MSNSAQDPSATENKAADVSVETPEKLEKGKGKVAEEVSMDEDDDDESEEEHGRSLAINSRGRNGR